MTTDSLFFRGKRETHKKKRSCDKKESFVAFRAPMIFLFARKRFYIADNLMRGT